MTFIILAKFLLICSTLTVVKGNLQSICPGNILQIFEDQPTGEKHPILELKSNNGPLKEFKMKIHSMNSWFDDAFKSSVSDNVAKIFLYKSILDQEWSAGTLFLEIGADGFETRDCNIYSKPVNRNKPYFTDIVQRVTKFENELLPPFHIGVAIDKDMLRGDEMKELKFKIMKDDKASVPFELIEKRYPTNYTIELNVTEMLDYEDQTRHELTIQVEDSSENRQNPTETNIETMTFILEVLDVHDQEPLFTKECGKKNIEEGTAKNTKLTIIQAIDGDMQVKNKIKYRLASPVSKNGTDPKKYIHINENTGEVTIVEPPDRESDDFLIDPLLSFDIQAIEYNKAGQMETEPNTVKTSCYFMITDIDDNAPEFNSKEYETTVEEHAPKNFALSLNIFVNDKDKGDNASYLLSLTETDIFDIYPRSGQNEASFTIRVKDPDKLDYDSDTITNHTITFKIHAVGMKNKLLNDTAVVKVFIKDTNDNKTIITKEDDHKTMSEQHFQFVKINEIREDRQIHHSELGFHLWNKILTGNRVPDND